MPDLTREQQLDVAWAHHNARRAAQQSKPEPPAPPVVGDWETGAVSSEFVAAYGFLQADSDGAEIFIAGHTLGRAGISRLNRGDVVEFRRRPGPPGKRDVAHELR